MGNKKIDIKKAKGLEDKIKKLDQGEMYSLYQILEKNKVNLTINMNGVYFDLLSLDIDIYKTLEKFVNQTLKRKNIYKNQSLSES